MYLVKLIGDVQLSSFWHVMSRLQVFTKKNYITLTDIFKLSGVNNQLYNVCILQFEVKPDEADKVCPNRPLKPEHEPAQKQKTKPVQKQKPKHVDPIDPPDIPDTSA